jgi:enolase
MNVGRAVRGIDERIRPVLKGIDARDQEAVDAAIVALDPTPLKQALGGNATVATSLAVLHAAAASQGLPLWQHVSRVYRRTPTLPLPEIQIFGGGAHANRRVDIQDFMIMVPGASDFAEALEVTAEVYHAAGDLLRSRGELAGVADEGGWWPSFGSNEEALETLVGAIELAGERPGDRVVVSLDIAASEFGERGSYRMALDRRVLDTGDMIELLGGWLDAYPIVSVEDPLAEDDVAGFREFTKRFGTKVQIVGDDFLVTNAKLVEEAAISQTCNTLLMKVNQAGTVSEAVAAYSAAADAGWRNVVSARSGETEDVSVSHLAVGLGAGQLKVGSFARSERMAKWNECLRIEEQLGGDGFVAGEPLSATWWPSPQ